MVWKNTSLGTSELEIDKNVLLTQSRLTAEGATLADLLGHFRPRFAPELIGDVQWSQLLKCAHQLPITMGAHPIFFEIPLHSRTPEAQLGAAMASGTPSAEDCLARARHDGRIELTQVISSLSKQFETENSQLREIIGRKFMLRFETEAGRENNLAYPGVFLRPDVSPIVAATGRQHDVGIVANALTDSLGWAMSHSQLHRVQQLYLAQPDDTRIDSFGIVPSKSRSIQLAVLGFKTHQNILKFLARVDWPGQFSVVDSIITRFAERMSIARIGLNIDAGERAMDPTLGLMLIVEQRQSKNSRYWIDGLTDWNPVIKALRQEDNVIAEKLQAIEGWSSKPSTFFARSGRFFLLSGIHHLKLIINEDGLSEVKAYLYLALSAAFSD